MKNKNNKNEKELETITYNILGNAFIGNDMSSDSDNTLQNLITYLESDEIKKLSKDNKK